MAESFDKKRNSKIIDTDKLNKALIEIIEDETRKKTKGIIFDSHLSHYLPKKYIDLCILTKCSIKELKKRLLKRGYPIEKVRENLDAEIFDTCRVEALEIGHNIKVIITG